MGGCPLGELGICRQEMVGKKKEGQGRSPRDHLGLEKPSSLSQALTRSSQLSLVNFHPLTNQPKP